MNKFFERMKPFVIAEGTAEVLGSNYRYLVVKQEFEPRLPGFVGLMDGVLFIADFVPEQYRQYIFWHEVTCVEKRNRKGCAQTVAEELARVPEFMRPDYTEFRRECFEALMNFYTPKPPAFYGEIVASCQYLQELCALQS